ncbi:MAG: hypothetical protein ABJC39_12095 [Chloroflexota bacterium]
MERYAIVVMSETGESNPGGQGRMLHALKAAKDFKAAGVPVTLVFHGIGVTWLTAFEERADKFTQAYGSLFDEVRDTIGGACNFCAATRFGAGESAERLGVPLLGDPGDHHTVAALVADGYTPIIL